MNEARIIMTAFGFLSIVMKKNNGKMPKEFMQLFRKLAYAAKMYKSSMKELVATSSDVVENMKYDKDVDYILVTVTMIAEYYEQMKGKKRIFAPLSFKQILELQEESIELNEDNYEIINDSMDFAEKLVTKLLELK